MLLNFLKIIYRNMSRDKSFTAINLFGLALGISAFLYIALFVKHEKSVDNFHKEKSQIFRLRTQLKWNDFDEEFPQTPPGVGTTIRDIFPEVEKLTRVRPFHQRIVKIDEEVFKEEHAMGADSAFLDIFNFEVLEGNKQTLLTQPNTVVLTESYAKKYFRNEKPLNQLIDIEDVPHKVTGVLEDPPANSHIQYSMLISNQGDETLGFFEWSWIWCNLVTYAKLTKGADPAALEAKFPEMVMTHAGNTIKRLTSGTVESFFEQGNKIGFSLEPLEDVYYSSQNNLGPIGNETYLNIFMLVGIFILLLAGINYVNLSTAKSMKRSMEVGIRKVMGSSRASLIGQFLAEAVVYCFLSTIIVFFMSEFLGNYLADNLDIRWDMRLIDNPWMFALAVAIALLLGTISGIYPAVYLSSFKPLRVLKGGQTAKQKSVFRNTLVVMQFMISFGLIILTFSVNRQIHHMRTMDIGIDTDNTLVIRNMEHLGINRDSFKETLKSMSGVKSAGFSSSYPSNGGRGEIIRKMTAQEDDLLLSIIEVEPEYLETYNIKVIEGQAFNELDKQSQTPKVLINETAVKSLGYENPIGQKIIALDDEREVEIAGIVKNFNHESVKFDITPLMIRPYFEEKPAIGVNFLSVKVSPSNIQETLESIKKAWQVRETGIPFEYFFCNEAIDQALRQERGFSKLLDTFSVISIVIACLGLAGLAMYTAEQKTKSIGIRKVLGATVSNILVLLSKGYARLLLLAFVLVAPISYWAIDSWLGNFANKIELGWWHFALPGLLLCLVALVAVSAQTLKAALAKPVDSLRNE
ncbi:ABC transporter permease [Flammeovirgaceae bacterium SG7u.111]|nr:ABC transporter permease [Flammeovirgaceae bacterium SG7u.132]WPO37455.1 ABC transporter permease [Flammeovirgaceae bacterium SG7u.111]